ncbi:MAG: glycosyltransferase [Actinomycetota bacterium]|nr:glycosyltransferase [Actinomycetota bacterium]
MELLLITYNRAPALAETLDRLARSPFAGCRLTVLDNHSSDETPEVCERFRPRFGDLHVIRHPMNIGANPNYLRAVELSRAAYTWVVADDDDLDFSDCEDVVAAIEDGEVDLISLGAPGREDWAPGRTSMGALLSRAARVFFVFTFMPNTIFRTELFDEEIIAEGYALVPALYPHFAFFRKQVERDASVLISKREIVVRRGRTVPGSELFWFHRWVRCCSTIVDPSVRRDAIYEVRATRGEWLRSLTVSVIQERLHFPERLWGELAGLAGVLRGRQLAALVLVAPIGLVPRSVLGWLRTNLAR